MHKLSESFIFYFTGKSRLIVNCKRRRHWIQSLLTQTSYRGDFSTSPKSKFQNKIKERKYIILQKWNLHSYVNWEIIRILGLNTFVSGSSIGSVDGEIPIALMQAAARLEVQLVAEVQTVTLSPLAHHQNLRILKFLVGKNTRHFALVGTQRVISTTQRELWSTCFALYLLLVFLEERRITSI